MSLTPVIKLTIGHQIVVRLGNTTVEAILETPLLILIGALDNQHNLAI
jgi:hypothetical protein